MANATKLIKNLHYYGILLLFQRHVFMHELETHFSCQGKKSTDLFPYQVFLAILNETLCGVCRSRHGI